MFLQLWLEKDEEEEVERRRLAESNRDHRPSLAEADAEYERLCQARKAQVANTNTNTFTNTNILIYFVKTFKALFFIDINCID